MPFTADQFFEVFARYNTDTWPAPVVLFVVGLGLAVVALLERRPHRERDRAIHLVLAGLWTWMALAYHLAYFRAINPLAPAFAALFLFEATALAWFALRPAVEHSGPEVVLSRGRHLTSAAFLGYSLVLYPALGLMLGQRPPALPTFGLPCPTTIFTLGILMRSTRRVPWLVYVIPTLWAGIATAAAVGFGVGEDFVLLPAVGLAIALNARQASPTPRTLAPSHPS